VAPTGLREDESPESPSRLLKSVEWSKLWVPARRRRHSRAAGSGRTKPGLGGHSSTQEEAALEQSGGRKQAAPSIVGSFSSLSAALPRCRRHGRAASLSLRPTVPASLLHFAGPGPARPGPAAPATASPTRRHGRAACRSRTAAAAAPRPTRTIAAADCGSRPAICEIHFFFYSFLGSVSYISLAADADYRRGRLRIAAGFSRRRFQCMEGSGVDGLSRYTWL
jgi:hypothetical protein